MNTHKRRSLFKRILLSRWMAVFLFLAGLAGVGIGILGWCDLTPKIAEYSAQGCDETLEKLYGDPPEDRVVHNIAFTNKDDVAFTYNGALKAERVRVSSRAEALALKASLDRLYEKAERERLRVLDQTPNRSGLPRHLRYRQEMSNRAIDRESSQVRWVITHARMNEDFHRERTITTMVGSAGVLALAGGALVTVLGVGARRQAVRAGVAPAEVSRPADTLPPEPGLAGPPVATAACADRGRVRPWLGVLVTLLGLPFFFGFGGAVIYGYYTLHKYSPQQCAQRLSAHGDALVVKDISYAGEQDLRLRYTGILTRWRGRLLGPEDASSMREALGGAEYQVKTSDYRSRLDADIVRDLDAWVKTQRIAGDGRDTRTVMAERLDTEEDQLGDVSFAKHMQDDYRSIMPLYWSLCLGGLMVSAGGVALLVTGRRRARLARGTVASADHGSPEAAGWPRPVSPPSKAFGCLAMAGLIFGLLVLLIGAFTCFLVSCEWSRGATQMGGAPRDPDDLDAAVTALYVGGSLLLAMAAALFPIRSWWRWRRKAEAATRTPIYSWRVVGPTLLVFFLLSALLATGFTLAMGHVKAEANSVAETGIKHLRTIVINVGEKGKFKAKLEAVEAVRAQYQAVLALCISGVGLLTIAGIHAIKVRRSGGKLRP